MEKVSAFIVDDEENSLALLKHFLEKYCSASLSVKGTAKNLNHAVEGINRIKPQLIFMDIIINDITGFDILDQIEPYNYRVIFVSSFDKYAIKAFQYNAVDYVLKPVEIDKLIFSVNKAYEEISHHIFTNKNQLDALSTSMDNSRSQLDTIIIPSTDRIDFIKLEEIVFCKSEGRYTTFSLVDGRELISSKNLGEYEGILDERNFYRIHNSYIANLKHIIRISKANGNYCDMVNGKSLPIAKRKQEGLFKFLHIK